MITMTKKRNRIVSSNIAHDPIQSNNFDVEGQIACRDLNSLYTCKKTFQCATGSETSTPCIPCAYKIGTFDIALDKSFSQVVRNVRPEMCPRSRQDAGKAGTYGFTPKMNILTIGDGDFTFSLALARMLVNSDNVKRKGNHSKNECKIVATSYESLSTLKQVYPSIEQTIAELEMFDQVKIEFNIDATKLSQTLSPSVKDNMKFHRIVWNFPCTAETNGQDGQNKDMDANKLLVRKFVRNSVDFLATKNSEIHMIHKTKPPYDQWKIEELVLEDWQEKSNDTKQIPLEYKARIVFDKCLLPPYTPRKALDKKSFPCHDACVFVFGLTKNYITDDSDELKCAPTISSDQQELGDANTEIPSILGDTIIPVTQNMISKIRNIHLIQGDRVRGLVRKKSKF